MQMTSFAVALMVSLLGIQAGGAGAQEQPAFKRSDPAALNTAGTFQLVEFYHPT
jgi:hypothetical protein